MGKGEESEKLVSFSHLQILKIGQKTAFSTITR
jgi:hypothetical protein